MMIGDGDGGGNDDDDDDKCVHDRSPLLQMLFGSSNAG